MSEVASSFAGSDSKTALREATAAAIAAGVFGVPTLRIGTELLWGIDAMPMETVQNLGGLTLPCGTND